MKNSNEPVCLLLEEKAVSSYLTLSICRYFRRHMLALPSLLVYIFIRCIHLINLLSYVTAWSLLPRGLLDYCTVSLQTHVGFIRCIYSMQFLFRVLSHKKVECEAVNGNLDINMECRKLYSKLQLCFKNTNVCFLQKIKCGRVVFHCRYHTCFTTKLMQFFKCVCTFIFSWILLEFLCNPFLP